MDDKKSNLTVHIIVAIAVTVVCIAAIIGILQPVVSRWVNNSLSTNTPLASISIVSETSTSIPSDTPKQISSTLTPLYSPNLATDEPPILFNEDFEDGEIQQEEMFSDKEWQIVPVETGNNVYDMDNSKGSEFKRIVFGSNTWKDYEVNFRARIISGSRINICFRLDEMTYSNYVVDIRLDMVTLGYSTHGITECLNNLEPITSHQHNLKRNEWYWINVQALDSKIKVAINGGVVISTNDTKHPYGRVVLQAAPYTHVQCDDIKVTALQK